MGSLLSLLEMANLASLEPALSARGIKAEDLHSADDSQLAELGISSAWQRARLRAACSGWPTAPQPDQATKERPFVNAFGMLFVPIPRFKTLFSIIPVRNCDYDSFCEKKLREKARPNFAQAHDHPVVCVNWKEAVAFAEWMTEREQRLGFIPANWSYRLPTDLEWSAAVGLPLEDENLKTPRLRSGKTPGFPWGADFPPPQNAGNYSQKLNMDAFPETSPVASFPANKFGIHDLGGNVWEWCMEPCDQDDSVGFARGASCFNDDKEFLLSSRRQPYDRDIRLPNLGFRVVLSATPFKKSPPQDSW